MEKETMIKKTVLIELKKDLLERLNSYPFLFENLSKTKYALLDKQKLNDGKYEIKIHQLGFNSQPIVLQEDRVWMTPMILFNVTRLSEKGKSSPVAINGSAEGVLAMVNGTYEFNKDGDILVDITDYSLDGKIKYNDI